MSANEQKYKNFLSDLKGNNVSPPSTFTFESIEVNYPKEKENPQFTEEYQKITDDVYTRFSENDVTKTQKKENNKKKDIRPEIQKIEFSGFVPENEEKEIQKNDNDTISSLIDLISDSINQKKQNNQIKSNAFFADKEAINTFMGAK